MNRVTATYDPPLKEEVEAWAILQVEFEGLYSFARRFEIVPGEWQRVSFYDPRVVFTEDHENTYPCGFHRYTNEQEALQGGWWDGNSHWPDDRILLVKVKLRGIVARGHGDGSHAGNASECVVAQEHYVDPEEVLKAAREKGKQVCQYVRGRGLSPVVIARFRTPPFGDIPLSKAYQEGWEEEEAKQHAMSRPTADPDILPLG